MKIKILNILVILIIIIFALWIVDFKLSLIFDIKIMAAILFSSVLLTATAYRKNNTDIRKLYAYQLILTSILASSLLYLKEITQQAPMNLYVPIKPVVYGLIYYIIFSIYLNLGLEKKITKDDYKEYLEIEFGLTLREISIAGELLDDKSNKEIASKLYITESTVKKHVQNIFRKSNVSSRQEFKQLID